MKIAGLQKTTLLDFPGLIACTVFLDGCNLRCPFCHNASLVLPDRPRGPMISEQALLEFLKNRKGKLDGVCITGGEPTLYKELPALLEQIHDMGFRIKLDTNGSNPAMLKKLVQEKLVDYVAMDIKNSPQSYARTCGGVDVFDSVAESAAFLLQDTVDYEFRTTVVHPLHTVEDMEAIGRWLTGAKKYFLQQFVDSGDLVGQGLSAMTQAQMEQLREAVLPHIEHTKIRGI